MRTTVLVVALLLGTQTPPTAVPNSSIEWDYTDADAAVGPITVFLVCLDGQPTAACAQVPFTAGQSVHRWKLPPLLAGPHTVAVQACTAGASACSTGATLAFTFQVLVNPKNLRLGGG